MSQLVEAEGLSRLDVRVVAWPRWRPILLVVVAVAAVAGFAMTPPDTQRRAVEAAGADLAHLLRMMALVKIAMAAAAVFVVRLRLGWPVSPPMALAYIASAGTMALGPGLVWGMAHVVLGAVLLHAGLALLVLMAWRDRDAADAVLPRYLRAPRATDRS